MANLIRFTLTNLPTLLFIAALVIAAAQRHPPRTAQRFLSWLLLLAVGVDMLWAGLFHVFFPATAARFIGWQPTPFQFEVGVSDIAMGTTALISFWRSLAFKAAIVWCTTLFYVGVAIGHVHQALAAGNFSSGNFGLLLLITVAKIMLLPALLRLAQREENRAVQ